MTYELFQINTKLRSLTRKFKIKVCLLIVNNFVFPFNSQKYLTQMLFLNTLVLQIRASFTLEKHRGKYSDEIQTTAAPIKTAQ